MKIFFIILVLLFNFQSFSKADDIGDFQIEGISIGDSLLDFYSKKELSNALEIYNYPGGNDFIYYFLKSKNEEIYEYLQIHVNPNDIDYKIVSIEGHIFFNNISKCHKKMDNIKNDLDNMLNTNSYDDSGAHPIDKSGKSTFKRYYYYINNNDFIEIICYDMSKEFESKGKSDRLIVSLSIKEVLDFFTYKAYN
tara:strand:+ start:1421 stop:2002 length:582 start_codon:yes stop_codon:yes gene_type:complete